MLCCDALLLTHCFPVVAQAAEDRPRQAQADLVAEFQLRVLSGGSDDLDGNLDVMKEALEAADAEALAAAAQSWDVAGVALAGAAESSLLLRRCPSARMCSCIFFVISAVLLLVLYRATSCFRSRN